MISSYMPKIRFSIILFFTTLAISVVSTANTNCSQYIGTCDYYSCLESYNKCGDKGYYLNFGLHYCKKYVQSEAEYSDNGQTFLNNIRSCLQEKLEEQNILPDCSHIKEFAVNTHKQCYEENNYCKLSFFDKLRVQFIAKKEIFDKNFSQFAVYLNQLCSR